MPYLETPGELADAIADLVGYYGPGPEIGDHPDECDCRMCWVGAMEDRIRESVKNEDRLTTGRT